MVFYEARLLDLLIDEEHGTEGTLVKILKMLHSYGVDPRSR